MGVVASENGHQNRIKEHVINCVTDGENIGRFQRVEAMTGSSENIVASRYAIYNLKAAERNLETVCSWV